jgi:hypothetical protein
MVSLMTKPLSVVLHAAWWIVYLGTVALASLLLPVQCRCGDHLPGPHALLVAVDQVAPLVRLPGPGASETGASASGLGQLASTRAGETPTSLEVGISAIAFAMAGGFLLLIPRLRSPRIAVSRSRLGRAIPPHAPPPRYAAVLIP